jgi:hypothetical protein
MAYAPHTLVAFGGTLSEQSGQDEIWECTIRGMDLPDGVPGNIPVDEGGLDTYLSEIATPLATWFAAAAHQMSSSSNLVYVKANNIGADGRYTSPTTHVHDYTTPVAGGVAGGVPSFLSVAYSWHTSRNRPPAARGRIYPPNFAVPIISGTSTIGAGDRAQQLAAALALLTLLQNHANTIWFAPSVVSKVGGAHQPINNVFVGSTYDVQRRRKYAVPELYTAEAFDDSPGA